LLVEQSLAVFVNPVDLENFFCQIDADSLNVHDGRSAQVVTIYHPTVAQDVGGDHSINKANRCCKNGSGHRFLVRPFTFTHVIQFLSYNILCLFEFLSNKSFVSLGYNFFCGVRFKCKGSMSNLAIIQLK